MSVPSAAAIAIRDAHARFRMATGTDQEARRYAELRAIVSAAAQERNQK